MIKKTLNLQQREQGLKSLILDSEKLQFSPELTAQYKQQLAEVQTEQQIKPKRMIISDNKKSEPQSHAEGEKEVLN